MTSEKLRFLIHLILCLLRYGAAMIFRVLAPFLVIASLVSPAAAQERVVIGTQRLADNGALFLAAAAGYFKAEGIDLAMTAYENDRMICSSQKNLPTLCESSNAILRLTISAPATLRLPASRNCPSAN